ncbi:Sjogren's syndrome/scleroderma autoantigen 1 family protein [Halapricum hydrolyticum]|uniref:Uncharacterized protein n=1 Tax=Halapricum hydrolyticum TaxID=2979991 RepID=A0AAE3IB69_9EURY|nr:Sjogren's syndrome/scleroderma autoantigen 1 family protein [Halapricum hydrolyticum]MCU4717430.1 hypothetical protein [Halapricum hydrolyticum]MCU4726594.1 hypothetical protein [Halapricum hydrolyticum]
MSDFDEEAERERLREQYERDEQKREATERMSELLLKGATMTNVHCETCGDPIFRYEGQLFCPTCEEVVAEDGTKIDDGASAAETDEGGSEPAAESTAASDTEPTAESAAETAPEDGAESDTAGEAPDADDSPTGPDRREASELPERRERPSVPDRDRSPGEELRRPDPPARREEFERESTADGSDDLEQARASLRRSLLRFAREAEQADDPRRARESLEAANEAADALVTISELR